ncbi:MAG TPA: hypothetical protein PLS25_03905 [Methanoregulaceae archaeon]|nr:hypothetical protein [Methanoregulaceae archaeon]
MARDRPGRGPDTRVDWFNNVRLLGPIGNTHPIEFENLYYQRQEVPAMTVGNT